MNNDTNEIHRLDRDDVPEVADVLCEAFHDYPVMRFVLGRDARDYDAQLKTLITYFVMSRVYRNEVMLGLGVRGGYAGVALVSRQSSSSLSPEHSEHSEQVWAELGSEARSRYEAFGAACANFQIDVSHIHLNMIGVRRSAQGRGVGRILLDYVHQMSQDDTNSEGVSLTTENPANIALYEHVGYQVVGHAAVGPDLETWGMFRSD